MPEILRFFKNNEVFIYLLLGILAVWQARKFTLAWEDLRGAAFGLEQESARARLSWSASILVLVFLLAVAEFSLVSFITPAIPEVSTLPTATLDLLATPTVTLQGSEATPVPAAASPVAPQAATQGTCIPGLIDILAPQNGETVRDAVEIIGSANTPNFGFYKFEISAANNDNWLTIQAGDTPVEEDLLGFWDTSLLPVGDYTLRLIVTDNQGQPAPPCMVQVRVDVPSEP